MLQMNYPSGIYMDSRGSILELVRNVTNAHDSNGENAYTSLTRYSWTLINGMVAIGTVYAFRCADLQRLTTSENKYTFYKYRSEIRRLRKVL